MSQRVPGARSALAQQVAKFRANLEEAAKLQTQRTQERISALALNISTLSGNRLHLQKKRQLEIELEQARERLAELHSRADIRHFDATTTALYNELNHSDANDDVLIGEYWALVQQRTPPLRPVVRETCDDCGAALWLTQEAHMACPQCGWAIPHLDATSTSMAYGDEVDFTHFHYKRETHFRENLNALQGKQNTKLAMEVLVDIVKTLQDTYGVSCPDDIQVTMIKPTLKKLHMEGGPNGRKFRTLYSHYMLIFMRLSGKPGPHFTPEQEHNVVMMFQIIQPLFEIHCPSDRKNFMSYNYCTYKFCQRLGYTEFLQYLPLLKCGDKLRKQDAIMRACWEDVGWEWIPTLPNEAPLRTAGPRVIRAPKAKPAPVATKRPAPPTSCAPLTKVPRNSFLQNRLCAAKM